MELYFEQTTKAESSRRTSMAASIESLPDEVLVEIFSRVPTTSIGRFRCVSKYWLNLTTNPSFIQSLFNLATQTDSSNLVIFARDDIVGNTAGTYWGRTTSVTSFYSAQTNLLDTPLLFPTLPLSFSLLSSKLGGFCNGMLSLVCWNQVCLFNPCTREYKIIDFHIIFFPDAMNGFGYDPIDQDYKLVQFVNSKDFDSHIKLYSLKDTSSCFTIPNVPYQVLNKGAPGFFLNGAIHWVADHKLLCRTVIIAFDIKDMIFRELHRPDAVDDKADITMGVLRGELYLCCSFPDTIDFEIWVMKDYGVQESWYKLFSTKEIADQHELNLPYARPLCYFEDFKILLDGGGGCLFSCDLKQTVLSGVTHGLDWGYQHRDRERRIISIVGSLVSLESGNYLGTISEVNAQNIKD